MISNDPLGEKIDINRGKKMCKIFNYYGAHYNFSFLSYLPSHNQTFIYEILPFLSFLLNLEYPTSKTNC